MNSPGATSAELGAVQRSSASTPIMRAGAQRRPAAGSAARTRRARALAQRALRSAAAAARARVHLRGEELVGLSRPLLLGVVHRRVGVASSASRRRRRRRGRCAMPIDCVTCSVRRRRRTSGSRSASSISLRHDRGLVAVVDAVQQDDELVAAQARDGVAVAHASRAGGAPPSLQQLVADGVAERVVDFLKRSRSMNSTATCWLVRSARAAARAQAVAAAACGWAGRSARRGTPGAGCAARRLAVGDVDGSADVVRQLALRLAHRADHQPRRKEFAVVAPQFRLALPGVARCTVVHRLWKNGASAGPGTRNSGRCPTTSWNS